MSAESVRQSAHVRRDASRVRKAAKIRAILRDFLGPDLSGRRCLDSGCAVGIITDELAPEFGVMIGVDVDAEAVRIAAAEAEHRAVFVVASALGLPVEAGAFDVVICAQVYEHVMDQPGLAKEIWRVLRPGGVCFFSGPNRLAIVEEHYWLPFLSWLPQRWADRYMRFFNKGEVYDVWPLSYWKIQRLWQSFAIHEYSLAIMRDPQRFAVDDALGVLAWLRYLPIGLLKLMIPFLPNYNWILVKPA